MDDFKPLDLFGEGIPKKREPDEEIVSSDAVVNTVPDNSTDNAPSLGQEYDSRTPRALPYAYRQPKKPRNLYIYRYS